MALKGGARAAGMGRFYGHVQSKDAFTNPLLWPHPVVDSVITAGVAVRSSGQRFADEGLGGIFMANEIARLDDPLDVFAIFDHATWEGRARLFARPPNPCLVQANATIVRRESLADLALACAISFEGLKATVDDHNRALEQNATASMAMPRTASIYKPLPIRTPPFYAIPVCAGVTYTMGGIAIDADARVQRDGDNGPIAGLFAAGSATGGHEGGPVAGYTGGLSKALTFGLIAGSSAAAYVNERKRLG
jgi:fumarate reductase flavoprotein subunit